MSLLTNPQLPIDSPFRILAGGSHLCTSEWSQAPHQGDLCYKLYFVRSGKSILTLSDDSQVQLKAGTICCIPGYHLQYYECPKEMLIDWVHFVPEAVLLSHLLSKLTEVVAWPAEELDYWEDVWEGVAALPATPSLPQIGRMQALLMDVVARILEHLGQEEPLLISPEFEELKPAVDFMDRHFRTNPPLAEIAEVVFLTPSHFHRKFSRCFGETPLQYQQNKRLQVVRQLLLTSDLTLTKIAEEAGFSDEFYLSRVFKKKFGCTPGWLRKNQKP